VGFECKVGAWSQDEDLDCPASRVSLTFHRAALGDIDFLQTQDMICSFSCSASSGEWIDSELMRMLPVTEPVLSAHTTDPISDFLSLSVSSVAGSELNASYAHGTCSFKLQLMEQCLHNPTELWHTEMLGNIFSIQDGERATAVVYPEGAGRIDERAKQLVNIGRNGLMLTFFHDQKTYFRFDGKSWDTDSKDEGDEKWIGVCQQRPFSRETLSCSAERGGERRVSEMACAFKC
jgi:hypothetical protein